MDPVSTATLGWLTQQARTPGVRGLERFVLGSDVQHALTEVALSGVEAAVREVVSAEQQDVVLGAVLQEGHDTLEVPVADGVDLPETIMAYLSPRLRILADRGFEVDRDRLSEVLAERVVTGIRIDANRSGPLRPLAELLLALPPGTSFADYDDDDAESASGLPGTSFGDDDDDDDDDES